MLHIKNLFYFYFSPSKEVIAPLSLYSKIRSICVFLVLNFLFFILFSIALYLLPKAILPDLVYTSSAETMSHNFIYSVLLAPLIEETVFRLWFVYSKTKLSISISILLPFVIIYLARYTVNVKLSDLYFVYIVASLCIVFPLMFFLLKRYETPKLISFWKKNQKVFIIISSLVFAFMHIGNYVITPKVILYFPILFLPQIFAGFLFSYTRIRIGFATVVTFHFLYNFIIYFLYILSKTS